MTIAFQAGLYAVGDIGLGNYRRLVVFVVLWAIGGVFYVASILAVSRAENSRELLGIVLGGAVLLRLIPLAGPAILSTDLYRYIWDGRVGGAGINPYCCIPSAPELEKLRDDVVFPMINRSDYAPTIYPPVAQMFFEAVANISQTVFAMKLAMVLAEAVAIGAMLMLLGQAGLPLGRVLVYAWNPVFVWEYAGNGHIDALTLAGIGIALLAAARGRQAASGIALAAATLTKFLPVVIGPALWRGHAGAGWKSWRPLPAALVISVLGAYACYASAGMKVFGFLGGYSREEGLSNGGGIFVLQFFRLFATIPPWGGSAWLALCGLIMAVLSARMLLRDRDSDVKKMGANALLLAVIFTVAVSPHYAWYYGWLAYLGCLAPWPSAIWLTIACAACYLDETHTNMGWMSLLYGPFLPLAARDVFARDPGKTETTRSC